MSDGNLDLREKLHPRNPLGIFALFVSFTETLAVVFYKILDDPSHKTILLYVIIAYALLSMFSFLIFLWFRPTNLYAPGDFRDDKTFIELMSEVRKVKADVAHDSSVTEAVLREVGGIRTRQELKEPDSTFAWENIRRMVDTFIDRDNNVTAAVGIPRAYLMIGEYDLCERVCRYLLLKVSDTHPEYYQILANLAYALVGKSEHEEARSRLLEVKNFNGGKNYASWHAVPLAVTYFHLEKSKTPEYWEALKFARSRDDYSGLSDWFRRLYPEIAEDL
ncbi:MAG TPA: hypothetical protein VF528_14425 [Pyrinomonadaceae bacterium]|jgi:hypothetical protein